MKKNKFEMITHLSNILMVILISVTAYGINSSNQNHEELIDEQKKSTSITEKAYEFQVKSGSPRIVIGEYFPPKEINHHDYTESELIVTNIGDMSGNFSVIIESDNFAIKKATGHISHSAKYKYAIGVKDKQALNFWLKPTNDKALTTFYIVKVIADDDVVYEAKYCYDNGKYGNYLKAACR